MYFVQYHNIYIYIYMYIYIVILNKILYHLKIYGPPSSIHDVCTCLCTYVHMYEYIHACA